MPVTNTAKAESCGHLGTTPLSDVLISILDRGLTGSLVVEEPNGQKSALVARAGIIEKAKCPVSLPSELSSEEKLCQKVEWLCGRSTQSVYGFYREVDFLHTTPSSHVDPLSLIWRCSREHANSERVDQVLRRLSRRPLRLHEHARLDRFDFNWDDLTALDQLNLSPVPLDTLLSTPGCTPDSLRRVIYVLTLTRHLDLGDGKVPLGVKSPPQQNVKSATNPSSARGVHRTTGVHDRRKLASSVPTKEPSTPEWSRVIGAESSIPPRVRSVVPASGGSYSHVPTSTPHPSALPLARLRSSIPAHGPRSTPQYQTLDPADAQLQAELLARKGLFEQALPIAQGAHLANPELSQMAALYAYLLARCGKVTEDGVEALLKDCTGAIVAEPEVARYHKYRAWVLKAAGRDRDAIKAFKRAAHLDPNDIDSARELRLYQVRQEREGAAGGFFGFLRNSMSPPPGSRPPKPPRR